jgi:predicted Zn-dependent protease
MKRFKKHPAVVMALILGLELTLAGPAAAITIQEEEKLGREFMKLAHRRYRVIEDPAIAGYVNRIGRRLLAQIPPQPFQYRFFVIQQDVYNAFAGPAGNIFINSGLIEAMESEDELAGILAHEITHVQARHISQRIERSSRIQWATLAGMVAGIFLGMGGAAEAGNALSMGSMAASQSASLAYSRQDEMQADELGIDTLTSAGYSPAGMLTMLKKIRDQQWFGPSDIPSYLMTHPAVDDRLAYLDTWIQGHPDALKLMNKRDNTAFLRFRTRLIAAYGRPAPALEQTTAAVKAAPADPAALHGYGIALARNGRAGEGLRYVKKALEKHPFDAVMLKDLGEIAFMAGDYDAARKALEGSKGIDPNDFETFFLLGRTQIELGEYSAAAAALETALEKQPGANRALYYLGEAYGKWGRTADAHYYLGRYYHNRNEFNTAAFHLRQVIKQSQDPRRKAEAEEMLSAARREAPPDEEASGRPKPRKAPFSYGQNGKTAW